MSLGRRRCLPAAVAILTAVAVATPARAQDRELTLYSGRHYQSDEKLYAHFTEKTGIKVNRIEGKEEELLERLKVEGASSPADVFITTDAARLGEAEALGLFAPVESKVLDQRIPATLRTATWFAFSTRARVIVFDRTKVKADEVRTYADLANPRLKGKLCVRSGSHPYNLSLGSALLAHVGRGSDGGVGEGGRRELRAGAEGRRHRPDPGRRRRRVPGGARQLLLPRPPAALGEEGGAGAHEARSRRVAGPDAVAAPTSTSPGAAC